MHVLLVQLTKILACYINHQKIENLFKEHTLCLYTQALHLICVQKKEGKLICILNRISRTLLPVVLAQLLNQFHDVTTSQETIQLNRTARYIQQDVNQFSSIESLPPQIDFLQFNELMYGNSGNRIWRLIQ